MCRQGDEATPRHERTLTSREPEWNEPQEK